MNCGYMCKLLSSALLSLISVGYHLELPVAIAFSPSSVIFLGVHTNNLRCLGKK